MNTALICVGAGAAGIVQAGHLSALEEVDISVDFIAGTSSGSINAGVFQSKGAAAVRDAWLEVSNKHVYKVTPWTLMGAWQNGKGVADNTPLRDYISHYISRVELKPCPLLISATDEVNRTPLQAYASDLNNDKLVDMVWASANLPILFPPVKLFGKYLTDGGITANAALREAVEWGADRLIILIPRNTPPKPVGNVLDRLSNMIATFMENMITREIKIIQAYNKVEGKRFVDICVIRPSSYINIGLLNFDDLGSSTERTQLINLHKEDALNQLYKYIRSKA